MTNKLETINKKNLCDVITLELITDISRAVSFAEDNGWKNIEYTKNLQAKIEKVGNFCDIVKLKGELLDTYVKKGRYGGVIQLYLSESQKNIFDKLDEDVIKQFERISKGRCSCNIVNDI